MLEQEAKFYLSNPPALPARLEQQGARLVAPRVRELNLRFDTPDFALTRTFQVLRLRQDARARLTYKGASELAGGIRVRPEVEFEVGDFEEARRFLEALGYAVSFVYEKYRTTWRYADTEVTLDETPLGEFAEIEGGSPAAIEAAARGLGLDWEARINESYAFLFERVKTGLGLPFRDLTFENFAGMRVDAGMLGVSAAD
jgi:adenylate cyclase class 2